MPFDFEPLSIPDLIVATPQIFHDDRGYLLESYDSAAFREAGISDEFVLDFYSKSGENVIRGLHIQVEPAAQAKLVHVISGEIFDVIVDLRTESESFGEYVTRELAGDRKEVIYVPEGFAHGYLTLQEGTIVHYKGSRPYSPGHICGITWDDPELDIDWPLDAEPVISEQDQGWPTIEEWGAKKSGLPKG